MGVPEICAAPPPKISPNSLHFHEVFSKNSVIVLIKIWVSSLKEKNTYHLFQNHQFLWHIFGNYEVLVPYNLSCLDVICCVQKVGCYKLHVWRSHHEYCCYKLGLIWTSKVWISLSFTLIFLTWWKKVALAQTKFFFKLEGITSNSSGCLSCVRIRSILHFV